MVAGHKDTKSVCGAARRFLGPRPEPMVLTDRDREIVRWVFLAGLATRAQIERLFFESRVRTVDSSSRCRRRMTLLYRNRYVDKLAGQPVNAPDIYFLSRHSTEGLRLLRALAPEGLAVKPRPVRRSQIQHTLDIASCRIALLQACAADGYQLPLWLGEVELAGRLENTGFMPDAYFQVRRRVDDVERTASFLLEVERSSKAERSLEERFRRVGDYYYQGRYSAEFGGIRALRVLMLVDAAYGIDPQRQIQKFAGLCARLEVTIYRFAALSEFLAQQPADLLSARIWRQPGEKELCALF